MLSLVSSPLVRLLLIIGLLVQPARGLAALAFDPSGCGPSSDATAACSCCDEGTSEEACCCRRSQAPSTRGSERAAWDAPHGHTAQAGNVAAPANARPETVRTIPCPCFVPQPIPHETESARGDVLRSLRLSLETAATLPRHLPLAATRLVRSISVAAGESHFSQRHFGVWRL
jgi:hypothetical protein